MYKIIITKVKSSGDGFLKRTKILLSKFPFTSIYHSKKLFYVLVGVLFITFIVRSFVLIDPDLGWHLKMGEIISKQGIPSTDLFSYTMPSFPHVDHEWLMDVFLYRVFTLFGQFGLAIIFATTGIIALLIPWMRVSGFARNKFFKYIFLFLLMLSLAAVLPLSGVRPQVLSWVFMGILFYITLGEKLKRLIYLLPLGFLLWANIHASFGAGLAFFALITSLRVIRTRKIEITGIASLVMSGVATMLTPYGYNVWTELWMTITDTELKWRIQEWYPSIFFFNVPFMLLLALSILCVIKFYKKSTLEELGVYIVLLIQAIMAVRHTPLWVVFSIPLIAKAFLWFAEDVKLLKDGTRRFLITLKASVVLAGIILFITIGLQLFSLKNHMNINTYPQDAVSYLSTNKPEGNIFSTYGWGGYLIWQLPDKKVFIDGRMPSWRREEAPVGESKNAMDDYLDVLSGKLHHKYVFQKYNVTTVLWSKEVSAERRPLSTKLGELLSSVVGTPTSVFQFTKDLEKNKWVKVYEDDVAVIYQKPI